MVEQANPICKRRFEAKGKRDYEAGKSSGYLQRRTTALFESHGFRLLTDPTFDPPGGK